VLLRRCRSSSRLTSVAALALAVTAAASSTANAAESGRRPLRTDAAPPAPRSIVHASVPTATTVIAVRGRDSALWIKRSDETSFRRLGGRLLDAPDVVSYNGVQYYIGVGADRAIWVRTDVNAWTRMTVAICRQPGAAVDTNEASAGRLAVACMGADRALWYVETALPADGSNPVTGPMTRQGGVLSAGPAVYYGFVESPEPPIEGLLSFMVPDANTFVRNGHRYNVYIRTSGDVAHHNVPWLGYCSGQPVAMSIGDPFDPSFPGRFGCQDAGNHSLRYQGFAESGTDGRIVGRVGMTIGPTTFYAEGLDGRVWAKTPGVPPGAFRPVGGLVLGGAAATNVTVAS